MIKEIIFVKKINENSIENHKIEINPDISLTKQVLEYCWKNLPFGYKPQFIG